jgi:hypothetical protein
MNNPFEAAGNVCSTNARRLGEMLAVQRALGASMNARSRASSIMVSSTLSPAGFLRRNVSQSNCHPSPNRERLWRAGRAALMGRLRTLQPRAAFKNLKSPSAVTEGATRGSCWVNLEVHPAFRDLTPPARLEKPVWMCEAKILIRVCGDSATCQT